MYVCTRSHDRESMSTASTSLRFSDDASPQSDGRCRGLRPRGSSRRQKALHDSPVGPEPQMKGTKWFRKGEWLSQQEARKAKYREVVIKDRATLKCLSCGRCKRDGVVGGKEIDLSPRLFCSYGCSDFRKQRTLFSFHDTTEWISMNLLDVLVKLPIEFQGNTRQFNGSRELQN